MPTSRDASTSLHQPANVRQRVGAANWQRVRGTERSSIRQAQHHGVRGTQSVGKRKLNLSPSWNVPSRSVAETSIIQTKRRLPGPTPDTNLWKGVKSKVVAMRRGTSRKGSPLPSPVTPAFILKSPPRGANFQQRSRNVDVSALASSPSIEQSLREVEENIRAKRRAAARNETMSLTGIASARGDSGMSPVQQQQYFRMVAEGNEDLVFSTSASAFTATPSAINKIRFDNFGFRLGGVRGAMMKSGGGGAVGGGGGGCKSEARDERQHRALLRRDNLRLLKWIKMKDVWMEVLQKHRQKLINRVRKGVPMALRGEMWYKQLAAHFAEHGVHAHMWAFDWFSSLFSSSFPLAVTVRVTDMFLFQGSWEICYRTALAAVQSDRSDLLRCESFTDIMMRLNVLPARLARGDALIEKAWGLKTMPSYDLVLAMEKKAAEALIVSDTSVARLGDIPISLESESEID
eukprot:g2348.t1